MAAEPGWAADVANANTYHAQRREGGGEKALGPDHPDVATSLNNLADTYSDQGRYADAEALIGTRIAMTCCRKLSCLLPVVTAKSGALVILPLGLGFPVAGEHAGGLLAAEGRVG